MGLFKSSIQGDNSSEFEDCTCNFDDWPLDVRLWSQQESSSMFRKVWVALVNTGQWCAHVSKKWNCTLKRVKSWNLKMAKNIRVDIRETNRNSGTNEVTSLFNLTRSTEMISPLHYYSFIFYSISVLWWKKSKTWSDILVIFLYSSP